MFLRLMALLVRCYPEEFRAEFGAEILGVLSARLAEAGGSRSLQRLLTPFQEFFGLLFSILQLWLTARIQKEPLMTVENLSFSGHETEPRNHRPGRLNDALLSGLPHLAMGLLIGLARLFERPWFALASSYSEVIASVLVILICGVLFFAWRRGWPLWIASWYLYGGFFLLALASFTVDRLVQDNSWQYTSLVFLAWIAAFIILYFRLYMRDPAKAMLSIAFFFPLIGIGLTEFVPGQIEGSVAIGLGLVCAAAAASIVRTGSYKLALKLIVGVNLLAGLLIAYVNEYQIIIPPLIGNAHSPSFSNFLTMLAFYLAFSFGVLFLPMGIWQAGKRQATA